MNNDRFKFRAWHKPTKRLFDVMCFTSEHIYDGIYASPTNPAEIEDCVLEQCTGLEDKNGKWIYEGDIVRTEDKGDGTITGVIVFISDRGRCGFYLRTDFGLVVDIALSVYEIIGNIHENMDLLEDRK